MDALDEAEKVKQKPTVIIAENVPAFHCGVMTQEQYETAIKELSQKLAALDK